MISAVYGLRAAARIFFGEPTPEMLKDLNGKVPADLTWAEKIPALILIAALLFIGFWPKSLTTTLNAALTKPAPVAAAETPAR